MEFLLGVFLADHIGVFVEEAVVFVLEFLDEVEPLVAPCEQVDVVPLHLPDVLVPFLILSPECFEDVRQRVYHHLLGVVPQTFYARQELLIHLHRP